MDRIQVTELGQIPEADIEFGDMTIFVGEQASGKSILLQLVKLVVDIETISQSLKTHGYNWDKNREKFLYLYFGEGMQKIWDSETTKITVGGARFNLDTVLTRRMRGKAESLLLIPAHRTGMIKKGWPRAFTDYDAGDPYVVRQFSERLRRLMDKGLGSGKGAIFPQIGRMDRTLQDVIGESIFAGAEVKRDSSVLFNRFALDIEGNELPFMEWSAGQREFMPLLLGLYLSMPLRENKDKNIKWVVIEEPEVGLHPKAISVLLAVFLELMRRGYKVIISTHSSQVLEMVWAIRHLAEEEATPRMLLEMLDLRPNSFGRNMAQTALKKTFKTYYFSRQDKDVEVKDISTLDADDPDEAVANFGGLTAFSTKVSDAVSSAIWKGNS